MRRHHRHQRAIRCSWCRNLGIQKFRTTIARFLIYFSQALSMSFCVYIGAGSTHISLWVNLTTSLSGVIIGHEMTRILQLHKFYSANSSDSNFINHQESQNLLSSLRKGIFIIGCVNGMQALLRIIVLGTLGFRDTAFLFANVTSSINKNFPTLGADLGLIFCENDCQNSNGMVPGMFGTNVVANVGSTNKTTMKEVDPTLFAGLQDCVLKCRLSQDMMVGFLAFTSFLQISAFFLARLIKYGKTD